MSTPISLPPVRRSVRLPFRVLAGIVLLVTLVAGGGTAFMVWRDARVLTFEDALMLPLMVWFTRLAFHAAVNGTSPRGAEWWPFATAGVWNCYSLLVAAYWILK